MARLTLTDGDKTRRFNLSTGKATFGSGSAAALRIASDDVAEVHGELELTDDGLVVRTAKGVMPPTINGSPVQSEHVLGPDERLVIGGAVIGVEYDEGEGPAPAPVAPAAPSRASRGGSRGSSRRAGGGGSRRRSSRAAADDDLDGEPRSGRRAQRKSDPTGVLIGVGVALGLILGGWFVVKQVGGSYDYEAAYGRAMRQLNVEGNSGAARNTLNTILEQDISAAQQRQVREQLALLDERSEGVDLAAQNNAATGWYDLRVAGYTRKFPVTEDRSHARAFMSRAEYFLEHWPTHPERGALEKLMERIRPVTEPSEPMTTADLDVVVAAWADIAPPRFYEAYEVIDAFNREVTDSAARERADQIRREVYDKEQAYAQEQLKKAQSVYTNSGELASLYNPGQAIYDLASILARCPDEAIRADAADRLLKIRELDSQVDWVRTTFKQNKPEFWENMVSQPSFRAWADENGLL